MTKIGIHIFRRDLRLYDNVALHLLSKDVDKILPIFIFDPFQIDHTKENESYRSDPAVKNMIESLEDLNDDLRKNGSKLFYFYGSPDHIIEKLIKIIKPEKISYNADYSKYAQKRDKDMDEVCKKNKIEVIKFMDDLTINKMDDFLNKEKPYRVFGAFLKHAIKIKPRAEVGKPNNFIGSSTSISGQFNGSLDKFYSKDTIIAIKGGRKEGLKILNKIKSFKNYENNRNDLKYHTTYLSGYMKFGVISILETFNAIKESNNNDLLTQMYWRQYFFILARFYHTGYDHVDKFFSGIKWKNDIKEARALWDDAKTGYPVVDAAVRQLQQEGYMHNRGRLIVSSFAVKV
jgi:deoxyribodipyrimidine photo-lyase